jgi:nucleotide-binding universal stress UspA family protein
MSADHHSERVVVGYDGSEESVAAVAAARRQAGDDGEVIVVHAYGLPPDFLGWAEYDQLVSERQRHGRARLDALVEGNGESLGENLEIELIGGPPAQALIDVAHARDADMVVVGSRGLGGVRGLLGSVSQGLLHRADLPVLVVPAGPTQS